MEIKFVNNKDIDLKKWDNAIEESVNGLVYASSWYLNIVNPDWTALIAGDYEIIMPLTFKKKYGIQYLYKSFFSQFLGVFYKNKNHIDYVKLFINEASKYYKFIEINLNVLNSNFYADYCSLKQTQVLSLSNDYEFIKNNYNKSLRNNLRKANSEDLTINQEFDCKALIPLIKLMYKDRQVYSIIRKDYIDLENIVNYAVANGLGEIHYAYNKDEICAAAFFLKWRNRATLQTGVNDIGKNTRAIFKLIDNYIYQNAGSNLLLDFAGSNIPGVKYRNLGFGARNEMYYAIRLNNLPAPIRWLKESHSL